MKGGRASQACVYIPYAREEQNNIDDERVLKREKKGEIINEKKGMRAPSSDPGQRVHAP